MMIIMSVHHHHHHHHHHGAHHHQLLRHRPDLFLNTFQVSRWSRRCADMIIMMTAGDAEDAS